MYITFIITFHWRRITQLFVI